MSKRQAGSIGGRVTVQRYGRGYMSQIGKRGNVSLRERYRLTVVEQSGYALVEKATGKIVAIW